MAYLLGIDLGTSSVKCLLFNEKGEALASAQQEYQFDVPREGWAEQDPEVWWKASSNCIQSCMEQAGHPEKIDGVGFSGQMHGLVLLDEAKKPVRPAIIWCDQRSISQVESIRQNIGLEKLGEWTGNQIATGFQTASLLWVKENEAEIYERTRYCVLPKDYIRCKLTGEIGTDLTDAAGTLAFDVKEGIWSKQLLKTLAIREDIYPEVHFPFEEAGAVTQSASAETQLPAGTLVVYGGGDQAMQAVGNGAVHPGQVSLTIGTGAQVFAPLPSPLYDAQLRAHTFNNVLPESWYFLGASLCGGLSLRWLRDNVLDTNISYAEMSERVKRIVPGSEGLVFLPYLSGERTPHMDPYARGMFFGLTLNHNRDHMMRAIMEGVVFSLKDCFSVLGELGQKASVLIASGGGARSEPWLQMQADIFNCEVYVSEMKEQACLGAAIMAGIGAGVYQDVAEACREVVRWSERPCSPEKNRVALYQEYYQEFKTLYQQNHDNMKRFAKLSERSVELLKD